MTSRNYPPDTVEQARAILEAWRNIDPALTIGQLVPSALEDNLTLVGKAYTQIDSLESQLTDARNQRDIHLADVWDMVKRVRTEVKAIYGDDSSEYEMVGGTRLSERKPIPRKISAD